jgi:hypothetical protein
MGNEEVVTAMNSFLGGNPGFTQRWILEPTPVTAVDVPALEPYLRAAWVAALPALILDGITSPWIFYLLFLTTVVLVYLVMRVKHPD